MSEILVKTSFGKNRQLYAVSRPCVESIIKTYKKSLTNTEESELDKKFMQESTRAQIVIDLLKAGF